MRNTMRNTPRATLRKTPKKASLPLRATGILAVAALSAGLGATAQASPNNTGNSGNNGNNSAQVDAGEIAGDLLDQELAWEGCEFPDISPEAAARFQQVEGLACADVTVPRDWHNPDDGHTITLRISVTDTADEDSSQGIALVNPGGPGGSGLPWGPAMADRSPALAEEFNFVGFDPRGVGESTPLECEYTPTQGADSWDDAAARVEGCLDNPLTPFITTEQTVYDMDFIRAVLGEDHISYVGYSYGTWLGNWYQAVFPEHSHRFLLDSATDLTRTSLQETWDLQPRSRDRQFQDMMLPYMARNAETYGLGEDPMVIREGWEQAGGTRTMLGAVVASNIIPAMYTTSGYPGAASLVAAYIEAGAAEAADATELSAQLEELLEASQGVEIDDVEARMAYESLVADLREEVAELQEVEQAAAEGASVTFSGTFEAIRCQDGQWNQSRGFWNAWVDDLNRKQPFIGPLMSAPLCAHWPAVAEKPRPHQNSHPDTLVVQSEFDAATPYEAGQRTAQIQPHTALITVANEGSHGLYPYGTTCVDDAVEAYMLEGTMPSNTVCGALPLPGEDVAYQVGGDIHEAQGTVQIKMRTDSVKQAERLVRQMMREQSQEG